MGSYGGSTSVGFYVTYNSRDSTKQQRWRIQLSDDISSATSTGSEINYSKYGDGKVCIQNTFLGSFLGASIDNGNGYTYCSYHDNGGWQNFSVKNKSRKVMKK